MDIQAVSNISSAGVDDIIYHFVSRTKTVGGQAKCEAAATRIDANPGSNTAMDDLNAGDE